MKEGMKRKRKNGRREDRQAGRQFLTYPSTPGHLSNYVVFQSMLDVLCSTTDASELRPHYEE